MNLNEYFEIEKKQQKKFDEGKRQCNIKFIWKFRRFGGNLKQKIYHVNQKVDIMINQDEERNQ